MKKLFRYPQLLSSNVDNLCITYNMKKIFVILLSFVFIFGLTACKKKDNISDLSTNLSTYNIDIDLNTDKKQMQVNQTLNYINNTDSILKALKFHLYPQFFEEGATNSVVSSTKMNDAYPNGMSYANFELKKVNLNNQDKSIVYENEFDSILSVELTNSLLPNKSIEIGFEYNIALPNCEHRFGYGNNTINLANFYPIACVYENGSFNTSPYNANGDPFYSDMANYNVTISLDKSYTVASTGEKTNEKIIDNKKEISYSAKLVRDFALVCSDKFEVINEKVENTNVEYYYFNDNNPEQSLKTGVDSIRTFSEKFGTYPYKNYSIVKTDFIHGGMEYPNLVMISADIENADDYLNVIIHETAHQWWYAMIGNDQYLYPWLDEALTEFSTILFYDYNEGYNYNHNQMIDASKANYSMFISVYEDVLGSIDTSMRAVNEYATEPEYTYCTYVKGVLMYESLYELIGEKKFCAGLKTYFENNKYKNVTPENLINAFEEASKQELSNFFDSWIKGKVVIR